MSATAATVETHHHECCSCFLPVAGPDLVTLPCDHYLCIECVNHLAKQHNRRWCLPCQKFGCGSRFALPLIPDERCKPSPTLYQQCVADSYSATVVQTGVLEVGSKIRGLAMLENILYVASNEKFLLKYAIENDVEIRWAPMGTCLTDIKWARGLASSRKHNTVYVVDWSRLFGGAMWVTRTSKDSWTRIEFDVQPFGISVMEAKSGSDESVVKIFVTCATPGIRNQSILLFHDDGQRVYVVATLQLPSGFEIPRHAVQLATVSVDEFAVCHGWTKFNKHRVSIVRRATGSDIVLQETTWIGSRGMKSSITIEAFDIIWEECGGRFISCEVLTLSRNYNLLVATVE